MDLAHFVPCSERRDVAVATTFVTPDRSGQTAVLCDQESVRVS